MGWSLDLGSIYEVGLCIDDAEFVEDTEELDLCLEKTGVDFLFSYLTLAGSRLSLFQIPFLSHSVVAR